MRHATALALAAAGLLAACGPVGSSDVDGSGASSTARATASAVPDPTTTASSEAGTPSPLSSSDLPTMSAPTAPPTVPTDVTPGDVLAGRITAIGDSCTEITTDDAVVWSVTGELPAGVGVGDVVRATVAPLADGEDACGAGEGGRLLSLEQVR